MGGKMKQAFKRAISGVEQLLCLAAVLAIFSWASIIASNAQEPRIVDFNIPAQAVDTALLAYSEQAGVQLIMDATAVNGIQSQGVYGSMNPVEALEAILASTGLEYELLNENTVTILTGKPPLKIEKDKDGSVPNSDSGNGSAGQESDSESRIEEIIVTAEKRDSTLQRTPIALTVITDLENKQIVNLRQVASQTPNVQYNEHQNNMQITIRGIGVDITTMMAEPGVAVHVDGVYRGGLISSVGAIFRHGAHRGSAWSTEHSLRPQRDRRQCKYHLKVAWRNAFLELTGDRGQFQPLQSPGCRRSSAG
jgi:hypothetical protein